LVEHFHIFIVLIHRKEDKLHTSNLFFISKQFGSDKLQLFHSSSYRLLKNL